MKGTLSEGVLPGLLRELYVGRRTGLLHFHRGEERCGVRFRHGHIVSGFTNVPEMRLGEILARSGKVERDVLDRASEVVLAERKRLGQILGELGILGVGEMEDAIALHLREILLRVFSWREGSYDFEEQGDTEDAEGDITLKVSTGEIILEAARMVRDPEILGKALGNLSRVLAPSTDPLLRFQKVTLTPADGYVLSRIDGILSGKEVFDLIPLSAEEVQKSLFSLLCTGIVEFLPETKPLPRERPRRAPSPPAPPVSGPAASPPARGPSVAAPAPPPAAPPPPRSAADARKEKIEARRKEIVEAFEGLRAKNHFEVLGIPRASSETQVKEAYFQLARRFHPDAHHDEAMADLRDKLEAVFIRLGQAYEILRNPRTRGNYEADLNARAPRGVARGTPGPTTDSAHSGDSGDSAPAPEPDVDPEEEERRAKDSLRQAEKLLAEEKYWDVIQLLENVIPSLVGGDRHRGRVALARAYLKNPKWVKQAEQTLRSILDEEPNYAEALFALGMIYRDQGMKARAVNKFRKVLQIKPEHEQAAAELAALSPGSSEPRTEGAGGFLRKLFGRQ